MAEFKHISGLKELSAKLKAMPEDLRKKTLKPAVGSGAKIVRDEARILAPKYEGITARGHAPAGTLKKSIILKWIREESSDSNQVFYVTVKRGVKFMKVKRRKKGVVTLENQDAYYWFMVEFGTSKMSAQAFMVPAFEHKKGAALDVIIAKLREGINKTTGFALQ